jgi:hypothetical protein
MEGVVGVHNCGVWSLGLIIVVISWTKHSLVRYGGFINQMAYVFSTRTFSSISNSVNLLRVLLYTHGARHGRCLTADTMLVNRNIHWKVYLYQ